MLRSRTIRLAAALAMAIAATGVALAGMSPAQAQPHQCVSYLSRAGYDITNARTEECFRGGSGEAGAYFFCRQGLIATRVAAGHASVACDLADGAA